MWNRDTTMPAEINIALRMSTCVMISLALHIAAPGLPAQPAETPAPPIYKTTANLAQLSAARIDSAYQPPTYETGWSGNFAINPGFEEDFVNVNAEGHVLSFKGDWYYNQKDLMPDYWKFSPNAWTEQQKGWNWNTVKPHAGRHSLKLGEGVSVTQSYQRAVFHEGGSAWSGGNRVVIPLSADEVPRFNTPWRASVWCRGGGSITLGGETASLPAGANWQLLQIALPADKAPAPDQPVTVKLTGPGEFDDLVVNEKFTAAPNLIANSGFERLDTNGYPVGFSRQQKFRAIGPTYYVWTDWNHVFAANRGPVVSDALVSRSGSHSLRFDVYPGDEKLVESDLIPLNQKTARVIEVGAWVRADGIKLIDVRCVNEDGIYMPGYRPRQPEYRHGGTFTFGNGTFGWRYVRKFFSVPQGTPVKGIRVRLCARGFNAHTLDDFGRRSQLLRVGTVWWDDLRVTERTTTAAELAARGVKVPAPERSANGPLADAAFDFGQRLLGENLLRYAFVNRGAAGTFQLRLTTTLKGGEPGVTQSKAIRVATGQRVELGAPYVVDRLCDELEEQGTFAVELLQDTKVMHSASYAMNTWTDVVDVDVSRAYNLPSENPVSVSMNLGVSDLTLARVKSLDVQLVRSSDGAVLDRRSFNNLPQVFQDTIANLPGPWESGKYGSQSDEGPEFHLPTPVWTVDRTNLIVTRISLDKLKVWPHDYPVRDTVLLVRGLDAGGNELFRQESDPFGRMQPPPKQPAIKTVKVREDGAVLINGEPRYLTGATHQNFRIRHTPPRIAQLGLMGHRLTQGFANEDVEAMFNQYALYALQAKPDKSIGGTRPVIEMTAEQRASFEAWVKRGGMKNVVSINTGGWEATIDFDNPQQVQQHKATNEYIARLSGRPLAISTSGAFNAWWLPKLTLYDINHAETEMWGPMDFNVAFSPYMRRAGKTTAWVYLPQLYDNHPYERYRFESYDNIIRGSAGVSMIQGIGDPTFNRGLAGELRYLEKPLNSLEKAPDVSFIPLGVSNKVTRYKGKTYVLATNCGPIRMGNWTWHADNKHSGQASHDGESMNTQWFRPGGIRIHGFRGMPMPEEIQAGDKIVQYVWIDPQDTPEWVGVAVRGDGRFAHNAVLGKFDFAAFRAARGNLLMFSELNHSVWHEVNYVMDDETYTRAVKVMGKPWADNIKKHADLGRAKVDKLIYQAAHFQNHGPLPAAGEWHRIEIDAARAGLVGKLVDGFAYMTKDGHAMWDHSVLERNGEVVRVFCEDSVGIDRAELAGVRINVPGLKAGTKVRVLFEGREIVADDEGFSDAFTGTDTYGYESRGPDGDLFGFVRDPDRELARMMPSGVGYNYGPTVVHIYEITH